MRHKCKLTCLSAAGWDEPYLRFSLAALSLLFVRIPLQFSLAVGGKCQPLPIRRPDRAVRVGGTACEAYSLTTGSGHHPDRGTVRIGSPVNTGDNKSHALTVR